MSMNRMLVVAGLIAAMWTGGCAVPGQDGTGSTDEEGVPVNADVPAPPSCGALWPEFRYEAVSACGNSPCGFNAVRMRQYYRTCNHCGCIPWETSDYCSSC